MSDADRQAAACLLPSFPGYVVPEWAERWLERGLGGITLFAYNVRDPEQLAGLTAALRARRPELLISIDEEGGDVTRLEAEHGSSYPGNLALGAVDDVSLTEEVASAIAGELARAGVNLNLAPVADTNTNPRNPVIGVRSFGSDPELVARHVAAFVTGTQRQGVAACAKHFPGHGDTAVDSHRDLPTVGGDLDAALLPFRAAIAAGVQAVMTGHLLVPGLDEAPATISKPILSGLLRAELGFDGLIVTDALEMQGISRTVGVPEVAVLALAAGADALCLGHDLHEEAVEQIHAAIVEAVRSGRLAEERLADAARRVAAICHWTSPTAAGAAGREVGAEAARRALDVDGDVTAVRPVPRPRARAGGQHRGGGDAAWARGRPARRCDGATGPRAGRPGRSRRAVRGASACCRRPRRASACVARRGCGGGEGRATGCDRRRDRAPRRRHCVDRHSRRRPRKPRGGCGRTLGVRPPLGLSFLA